ncbi:WAT1-related protein At1g68170-like [Abrus precatorius]|uniref:WAT1-related protein At1g68170-like n=1 Tax=Abrus precatorius TaxID=3816 RepID=A0A8B8KYH1_ABRPR|nr:WAT1-related protein At1g68170-like [Abrus precatorius]
MDTLYNIEAIGNVKPVLLMIAVQSLYAVVNILLKLVADDGMSLSVLIAYRFIFASAFIVPVALIFERKSLQNLTGQVLFQALLCGLFGGTLLQNLYVKSLALVSAMYATAMLNLIPAVTYILSVSLRLEKSNLGTLPGMVKFLGTLTGIGGAMILTFYKGRRISIWSTHIDLVQQHAAASPHGAPTGSRLWGCMLALGTSLSYSFWLIIQTKMSKKFPWHYSIAALTSATSSILSIIYALCTERDWTQWKLGWNLRLLAAVSSGVFASGVCYPMLAWCVRRKGPLFASAFSPFMLVIVTLAGSLVLDESLHIGSLTGSVLIVSGLYMLLWGQNNETWKGETEMVSSKGLVQCDSVHVADPPLACNQREHDKKIAASVPPYTPTLSLLPSFVSSSKTSRLLFSGVSGVKHDSDTDTGVMQLRHAFDRRDIRSFSGRGTESSKQRSTTLTILRKPEEGEKDGEESKFGVEGSKQRMERGSTAFCSRFHLLQVGLMLHPQSSPIFLLLPDVESRITEL